MADTPAPALVIDCTTVEIEPAVIDPATGNVLKPPVLQPPQQYVVPLDGTTAFRAESGEEVTYDQVGITGPPETVDEWNARQTEAAAEVSAALERAALTNQQTLLHTRNRWLGESDAYMLPTNAFPADMPDEVKQAIAGNQAELEAWRKQLRDWPSTVTDWADPPALPAPPSITLTSGRQLIIVT